MQNRRHQSSSQRRGFGGQQSQQNSRDRQWAERQSPDDYNRYDTSSMNDRERFGGQFGGTDQDFDLSGGGSRPSWSAGRGNPSARDSQNDFGQSSYYGQGSGESYGRGIGQGASANTYGNRNWAGSSGKYDRDEESSHRGRGPKGYRRGDERILEDINERLADDPSVDASEIIVEVSDGVVTLSGTVSEKHMKRLAEDIAEQCSGVSDVTNNIKTQRTTDMGRGSQRDSQRDNQSDNQTKKIGKVA